MRTFIPRHTLAPAATLALALVACDAHPEVIPDAGNGSPTAPMDLSAGTTELPQRALPPDTTAPLTPDEESVSPHPHRSVPERYEVMPPAEGSPQLPSQPMTPVPETPAPTDGMPVMQPPVSDPIAAPAPEVHDSMPIVRPAAPQTPAPPTPSGPFAKAGAPSPINAAPRESRATAQLPRQPSLHGPARAPWARSLSYVGEAR